MFEIKIKIDVTDKTVEVIKMLSSAFVPVTAVNELTVEKEEPKQEAAPEPEEKTTTTRKPRNTTTENKEEAPKEEKKPEVAKTDDSDIPTKEELRKIAVQAIQKNRQKVVDLKEKHWPDAPKITSVPEADRAMAVKLLNEIITG